MGVTPILAVLRGAHGPCPPDHNKKPDARIYFRYSAVVSKWPVTPTGGVRESQMWCGVLRRTEYYNAPIKGLQKLNTCMLLPLRYCASPHMPKSLFSCSAPEAAATYLRVNIRKPCVWPYDGHRRVRTCNAQFSEPTSLARPIASSGG